MDNLFTTLSKRYEDFLVEFISWYKAKRFATPIKVFVSLEDDFQVGIFHGFLHQKHNVGLHYDEHTYVLYWVDPLKKTAREEILKRFNDTKAKGISHTFVKRFDLPKADFPAMGRRAILKAVEYIVEPF